MLLHQHRQVKLGDRLKLEDEHLHHLDQQLLPIAALLLGPQSDALHQVEEELAAHGLYGGGQRLVVDILAGELHGPVEVSKWQLLSHVVDEVSKCGVGQRPQSFVSCPAFTQQNVLIKQFLHQRNKLGPEICGENVTGCNEKFLPEVSHLVGADGQQGQHPLHHQPGVEGRL